MPFLAPVRPDLGWINASPENMKTAWGVACTTMLFTMWLISQYKEGEFRVVKTNLYLPIFGFIVWSFITLFWVEDGYLASIMLSQFISYAFIFFVVINIIKKTEVIKILNVLIALMSIVSIIGLAQYYFSDIHSVKYLFAQTAGPGSTFANKNMASHFIVMTLPLAFVLLLSARDKFNIVIYSIASSIGSWFLIYTFARQAYVAMSVELFILLLVIVLDYWKNKNNSLLKTTVLKRSKGIALITILLLLSLAANFTDKGWGSELNSNLKTDKILSIVDTKNNPRFPAWRNTIEMIKEHPITGVGVGQWGETYPLYYDRVMNDVIFNEKTQLRRLHNDYLEMFANFGLIGYLFLLWLLYLIAKIVLLALTNKSNEYRNIVLAVTLGLTGFSVVAMFSFPVRVYLPAFLVFVYISLLFNLDDSCKKSFVIIKLRGKVLKLFLFLSILAGSISVFASKYAYDWLIAEHHALNASALIILKKYNLAVNSSLEALLYNKKSPVYYFMVGSSLLNLNRPKDSIFFLKKAIDISPFNTRALLQLAVAYQSKPTQDLEMERKVLEFILSFDPKNVNALSYLVKNLSINNRGRDAAIVYKRLKHYFEHFNGRSNFGPYHAIVGLTAISVGDYKYAQYIYKDAIKQLPSAQNYYNLAILEYDYLKNYKNGVDLAKKSLAIDPNIPRHKEMKLLIEKYESITKQ
jgi:tetratricopeptide (TPR) repeat protein